MIKPPALINSSTFYSLFISFYFNNYYSRIYDYPARRQFHLYGTCLSFFENIHRCILVALDYILFWEAEAIPVTYREEDIFWHHSRNELRSRRHQTAMMWCNEH
jgi:hypothetical protein